MTQTIKVTFKKSTWVAALLGVCWCLGLVGCGDAPDTDETTTHSGASHYVAQSEPDGAIEVGDAPDTMDGEQPMALVGVIGGSREPFVDGLVAFTIVDPDIPYCQPEEGCPTPWDYCCTQDQVKDNIATVTIVDASGDPVSGDAKQLLGVTELATVVVEGTVRRDPQGNLTVAATRVFVRSAE